MDMPQRLATFPADSYDVPLDSVIVRYGDGPSMMADDLATAPKRPVNHLGQEIPPTPYELAHAEAQRVAALPVEQGGLGLPVGNTAMDRARGMGFDTDAYHGTYSNFTKFNTKYSKDIKAIHVGTPEQAGTFAAGENGQVMPLMVSPGKTLELQRDIFLDPNANYEEMARRLKYELNDLYYNPQNLANLIGKGKKADIAQLANEREVPQQLRSFYTSLKKHAVNDGYDSLTYPNKFEGEGDSMALFKPNQLRSRFAAFNPALRDSADLLASYLLPASLAGLLGYGLLDDGAMAEQ
jgi:hypothetical protein